MHGPAPELPSAALAFAPVDQLEQARLEITRHHPDPQLRRRTAIALATAGRPAARIEALRLLLADLAREPARRDAVADLLLAGLSAVGEAGEPMVATPEDLLALVFGLRRAPTRARPELKGQ